MEDLIANKQYSMILVTIVSHQKGWFVICWIQFFIWKTFLQDNRIFFLATSFSNQSDLWKKKV